jgi:hypothetical protein
MWSVERTILREGTSQKTAILRDGAAASFADVVAAWRNDAVLRDFFIRELADIAFPAYFWEMPPIRRDTTGRDYEFVTIRSDALAHMRADTEAFAAMFATAADPVVTFPNLGGDALLVAPRPLERASRYPHLAEFLRAAPQSQQHELFKSLGAAVDAELRRTTMPIWVSTSGLGVAWLHVRLDSYPKYYQHRPYAEERG